MRRPFAGLRRISGKARGAQPQRYLRTGSLSRIQVISRHEGTIVRVRQTNPLAQRNEPATDSFGESGAIAKRKGPAEVPGPVIE